MIERINVFLITVLLGMTSFLYNAIHTQIKNHVIFQDVEIKSEVFCNDTIRNTIYLGWGYNIYIDGKLFIHQPHIPALPGNKGFITAIDAYKTSELVISKIKKKIIPPDISIHELDSLKIKFPIRKVTRFHDP